MYRLGGSDLYSLFLLVINCGHVAGSRFHSYPAVNRPPYNVQFLHIVEIVGKSNCGLMRSLSTVRSGNLNNRDIHDIRN